MSSGVPPNPARSNRCAASARLQSERSMGVRSFCQAAGPDARAASDAVAGAARTRPRGCVEAYSDSSRTSISILFLLRGVGGTGLTSRRLLGPSHEEPGSSRRISHQGADTPRHMDFAPAFGSHSAGPRSLPNHFGASAEDQPLSDRGPCRRPMAGSRGQADEQLVRTRIWR